ncbi:MAG: HD domain-containing protein [Burkholderiales bacterium]|nr:HD domain-containing protein [Burkholderiales bacterium]
MLPEIDDRHQELFRRALPFLRTRHNAVHTRVAYGEARWLLRRHPDADESVVLPAILLHDVGWSAVAEGELSTAFGPHMTNQALQRLHETEGARIAAGILAELGFAQPIVDAVVAIVDGHDTRTGARSLDDALVRDADRLWRYTPAGSRIDAQRFGFEADQHLAWLERNLDAWLSTPAARQRARDYLDEARRSAPQRPGGTAQRAGSGR